MRKLLNNNEKGLRKLVSSKILLLLGIISLMLLVACQPAVDDPKQPDKYIKLDSGKELQKFDSVEDLVDYLEENKQQPSYNSFGRGGDFAMAEMAMDTAMVKSMGAAPQANEGATEYSTTNIQVDNVDESDFIKNDNKYIYIIADGDLAIYDVYPAKDANRLSLTAIEGTPLQLFLNDDKVIVFARTDDEAYVIPKYDFAPRQRYSPTTHAYVFDVSDRSNPKLTEDFSVNGNFFSARMIGDYVYFIAKDSVYYYNQYVDVPMVRSMDSVIMPEIYYFDNPENNYVFHTIASFNVNDNEINAETYMMGHSNTLYVSQNNIYITYQKNLPYKYYQDEQEDRFFDVVVPLLPLNVKNQITKNTDWQQISEIMETMYEEMSESQKENLIEEIADAIAEYEAKKQAERMRTVIHKIEINKGDLTYVNQGEVEGYLLNQFSLDEYKGNLRVATTTNLWTSRENIQYNNVIVLNENMKQIGELTNLAEDERIYSTRFMGEKLYMVTFKRVDPLFVISLENPENPKVLGELKIPGYSDYLHPFDENHIIGIGKETKENQWGGISTKGVKMALFDVSDVSNPKVVESIEIGDSGSDSPVLRDHKAFLFDKEKELLVLPVREVISKSGEPWRGRQNVWHGAMVFKIDESGFTKQGEISHSHSEYEDYWYYSPFAVQRSLYMDDTLYTISSKKIVANDLDSLDELKELKLPYSSNQRIYW